MVKKVDITLDEQSIQKAKAKAKELGLSLSAYIRLLINSN